MRENSYHDKVMRMLQREYSQGLWESNPPSFFGKSGKADITGTFYGHSTAIETKKPGLEPAEKHLTKNQRYWRNKFVAAGGSYLCTSDITLDEIHVFLETVEAQC